MMFPRRFCIAFKEPLINSGRAAMRFETVSGKARIAANSWTIGKIRNAAGGRFGLIDPFMN